METVIYVWWIAIAVVAVAGFTAKLVRDDGDIRRTRLPKKNLVVMDRINSLCTALMYLGGIVAILSLIVGGFIMMIDAQV